MDITALKRITELAEMGLPICLKQIPGEPGLKKSGDVYGALVEKLKSIETVVSSWDSIGNIPPLITVTNAFDYWCRESEYGLFFFLANPKSQHLTFPLEYGQSLNDHTMVYPITIHYHGNEIPLRLVFKPYQSLLIRNDQSDQPSFIDITFQPQIPVFKPRVKSGKEKWEVIERGK